ncbi:hypothetical protein INT45_008026 [Circinella minor]|uniref:BRCT domain-containing protein n=1 Tax=Circinella minor TaxID=1195481 RepID=A0A8H7VRY2_9FUNG|nr:hypothetical protein INT45_008026 [Circinella minor]
MFIGNLKLNVILTEGVYKATHLVTNGNILRTVKFLSAVSLNLKITTKKWLDASIEDGKLLDPDEYPLVDEIVEREQMFNFRDSLEEARKDRQATYPPSKTGTLLQSYKFYFSGSKSEIITLEQIVRSAGGQVIKDLINQAEKSRSGRMGYRIYNKDVAIITSLRQSMKKLDQFVVE